MSPSHLKGVLKKFKKEILQDRLLALTYLFSIYKGPPAPGAAGSGRCKAE